MLRYGVDGGRDRRERAKIRNGFGNTGYEGRQDDRNAVTNLVAIDIDSAQVRHRDAVRRGEADAVDLPQYRFGLRGEEPWPYIATENDRRSVGQIESMDSGRGRPREPVECG